MDLKQRDFFNNLAAEWDNKVKHDPKKLQKIMDFIDIKEGARVLDVGCGTGVLVPYIVHKIGTYGKMIGLDISENMLKVAKTKFPSKSYPNVDFVLGDLMEYIDMELFDIIICYSSFPHFPNKKRAIKKMASLLRPQGELVICHSESRETINNMHRSLNEVVSSDILPSGEEVASYMKSTGLHVIKIIDSMEMYVIIGKN